MRIHRNIASPPPSLRPSCVKIFELQTSFFQRLVLDILSFNRKNYKLCYVSERSILVILKSTVDEAVKIDRCRFLFYALY